MRLVLVSFTLSTAALSGADLEIENGGFFYPRAKRVGKIFA